MAIQGPYSPTILKNILLSFSTRFCKFECNITSDWLTVWFSQSEVVLHSNASKNSGFGKISCVSTGVRKPVNTCASPTAVI